MYVKYVGSYDLGLTNVKSICSIWPRHGCFDYLFSFVCPFWLNDQLTPNKKCHYSQIY
jgi:hypothetical protein